jgi:hypoxanthine phosphoribosyltransferase
MKETVKVLFSEKEVTDRIKKMGEEISTQYEGCSSLRLICILKGGVFFMTELAKNIKVPCTIDFMSVSSYADKTQSSGRIRIIKDLDESIEGKDVLIVEDIIDSGRTLSYLMDMLKQRKPRSLKLCTLLDKPDRREAEVNVDYSGFTVPDTFIVGFGLDYAQRYRNLPFIGTLDFT